MEPKDNKPVCSKALITFLFCLLIRTTTCLVVVLSGQLARIRVVAVRGDCWVGNHDGFEVEPVVESHQAIPNSGSSFEVENCGVKVSSQCII